MIVDLKLKNGEPIDFLFLRRVRSPHFGTRIMACIINDRSIHPDDIDSSSEIICNNKLFNLDDFAYFLSQHAFDIDNCCVTYDIVENRKTGREPNKAQNYIIMRPSKADIDIQSCFEMTAYTPDLLCTDEGKKYTSIRQICKYFLVDHAYNCIPISDFLVNYKMQDTIKLYTVNKMDFKASSERTELSSWGMTRNMDCVPYIIKIGTDKTFDTIKGKKALMGNSIRRVNGFL